LKKEVKALKEEYKECMEALKQETYDKNKAETLCQVLKDKIEAEKKDKTANTVSDKEDDDSMDDMSVDGKDEWKEQRKPRKKKKDKLNESCYKCDRCNNEFKAEDELKKHKEVHIELNQNCGKCEKSFKTEDELRDHCRIDHSKLNKASEVFYTCAKCDKKHKTKEYLSEHLRLVHAEKQMETPHSCQKCDRIYSTMSKLRRHDWRCHREIECNKCGENIASRQDLKEHRETQHQMRRKVFCRFFPNCMDEEECLYEHEKDFTEELRNGYNFCSNGARCNDQSCRFSEQSHMMDKMLCKFQANCNRLNCSFKHSAARKAFLEVDLLNTKRK
jgi:hypothetical protein